MSKVYESAKMLFKLMPDHLVAANLEGVRLDISTASLQTRDDIVRAAKEELASRAELPFWLQQANRNPHAFHITAEYAGGKRGYYTSKHSIQFAKTMAHKVRCGIVYNRAGDIVYEAG